MTEAEREAAESISVDMRVSEPFSKFDLDSLAVALAGLYKHAHAKWPGEYLFSHRKFTGNIFTVTVSPRFLGGRGYDGAR